jgi:formylglycine-generating enzyme required for sulfatase activity
LLATCTEPDRHPQRSAWQARVVALLAEGVRPCVPGRSVRLGRGVEMTFSFIPPGSFLMGSPPDEEARREDESQHRVTLTQGFYLGIHPVTQAQWQAVLGSNPSHFQGTRLPVNTVSWEDCQEFCGKLSERDGQRYRLPSEAQWEYACRAGTTTPFHFGPTISTDQVNYNGNYIYGQGKKGIYRKKMTAVGSFPANAWGLFDLHGEVWEWCQDALGQYGHKDATDPLNDKVDYRVLRGGSWLGDPGECRAAFRNRDAPVLRYRGFGCRVVLCLDHSNALPPVAYAPGSPGE